MREVDFNILGHCPDVRYGTAFIPCLRQWNVLYSNIRPYNKFCYRVVLHFSILPGIAKSLFPYKKRDMYPWYDLDEPMMYVIALLYARDTSLTSGRWAYGHLPSIIGVSLCGHQLKRKCSLSVHQKNTMHVIGSSCGHLWYIFKAYWVLAVQQCSEIWCQQTCSEALYCFACGSE